MPRSKNCSCKQHEYIALGKKFQVYRIDSKKFKKKVIEYLLEIQYIYAHSTNLCTVCAAYAEENIQNAEKSEEEEKFEALLASLNSLTSDQVVRVAYELGKMLTSDISNDSKDIAQDYKRDEYLSSFDVKDYIKNRNKPLVSFFRGVAGSSVDGKEDIKTALTIAKAMEHTYYLANSLLVAPLCFASNLLTYYFTSSKNACLINSSGSPSGSYTTVCNWINSHTMFPLECPVDSDVITFFDNNQVIGRKWRVQFNFKCTTSVITTLLHIVPEESHLQKREDLSPAKWLNFDSKAKASAIENFKSKSGEYDDVFKTYRNKFISEKIKEVLKQQVVNNGNLTDNIDEKVCNIPDNPANERYTFVESMHQQSEKVCLKIGEPCLQNPCSYEAVEEVFDHILTKTLKNNTRQWTILGCDGLPFTLGSRLIENVFLCKECKREYDDEPSYVEHKEKSGHDTTVPLQEGRKYNNILLLPGLGHYEINMVKAIFKLLWEIGLIDLAKLLGYKSPKALASCQGATDHHKSWQILQIFLHAMSSELILPYCRVSLQKEKTPTLQGFYSYIQNSRNPNYRFLCDSIFTYLLSLHVFRAGVRRNNHLAINASLHTFSPLFYGFNMPFYMETYIRDRMLREQTPPDVLAYLQNHEAFTVSGSDSKGEGGDFVLENINRKIKMWLPAGSPSDDTWMRVYRNIERLDKVEENMTELFGITSNDCNYTYAYNIEEEKIKFRQHIRNSGYLSEPLQKKEHTTMGGKRVDGDFLHFEHTAKSNRDIYWDICKNSSLGTRKKINPIFVYLSEKEKYFSIENKTKAEIIILIQQKMKDITSKQFNAQWKKVKNGTKCMLLNFLKEIDELTEN